MSTLYGGFVARWRDQGRSHSGKENGVAPRAALPERAPGGGDLGETVERGHYLEPPLALHDPSPRAATAHGMLGRKNHYGSKSRRGTEVAALFVSGSSQLDAGPHLRQTPG
jgi:hypothetical protein